MAHRVGVCQSCRARFQIPASFAPNRAKCRNCGGVVAIGPPEGAPEPQPCAPQPVVAVPAPEPEPPPVPPPPAPAPKRIEPEIVAPARRRGLVRALLVAGIAAVLAFGLWSLLA